MIKKTNTLVQDFQYVSPYDDAVDETVEDFPEKWQRYLDGMEDPPLKAGVTPTMFVLKHLTSVEMDRVKDIAAKHGTHAAALAACALGLKSAKNWDEGKDYTFQREKDDWINTLHVVTAEELAKLSGEVRADIGFRVFMAAQPRPN